MAATFGSGRDFATPEDAVESDPFLKIALRGAFYVQLSGFSRIGH